MTKQDLEQYNDLLIECEENEIEIKKIEREIDELKNMTVKDSVSGGFGGIQHFVIEGTPVKSYNSKINALRSTQLTMMKLQHMAIEKRDEIEKFISSVDNSRIRRIIRYKYIDCLSWYEVAERIGGKCNSESVRKELERYLHSYNAS